MLSRIFLIKQGQCCGLKCTMCPYIPKHSGNTESICPEILNNLEDWEISELNNRISLDKK